MKFNILTEFRINEVESFALVATIVGIAMFGIGLAWDKIAGVQIAHNPGLGLGQILWCAFWGVFSVWGMLIATKWGE